MLCGPFGESREKKLKLHDVDEKTFIEALGIWTGRKDCREVQLDGVQHLAIVADRFQMAVVLSELEVALCEQLSVDMCGEVLMWSGRVGMQRLERAALKMATEQFEKFVKTAGFMLMGEHEISTVVDDNRLVARNEEVVWEAVADWMSGRVVRGHGVMRKIRFPLMEEEYLASQVVGMVGEADAEWMAGVVAEAMRAKAARREGEVFKSKLLGRKALMDRVRPGVKWEEYIDGGELRLGGHESAVTSIVACDDKICSGSYDGSIRIWKRSSGEHERTLQADRHSVAGRWGCSDGVNSLAVWKGRLVSGLKSGRFQVWNVATGECEQVLEGHHRADIRQVRGGKAVRALAVCGSSLASGSDDGSIKVWRMGAAPEPNAVYAVFELVPCDAAACERENLDYLRGVESLAGLQDKLVSGSGDGSIRVWDVGTGAHDATLAGHTLAVTALLLYGDRLFSASQDGTIRAWALGTWAMLLTVQAHEEGTTLFPLCLAVSGSRLVSGSLGPNDECYLVDDGASCPYEWLRVWGLEELDLQVMVPQRPSFSNARALLAVDGEVWGGVGSDVVVWGRRQGSCGRGSGEEDSVSGL
jgi:hypothetical protein